MSPGRGKGRPAGGSRPKGARPQAKGRRPSPPSKGRGAPAPGQGRPTRGTASRGTGSRGTPSRGTASRSQGLGGTQVEGRQAVRELLLAGRRRVRELYLGNEVERVEVVADIVDLAAELRVPVTEVSRARLDRIARTEAPQGVVAVAEQLPDQELSVLCRPREGRPPFLLAVDGVTDPGNLGALLRIAECAGVTGVVLPRHRAVHVTPTVAKAAAGAVEYLPMSLVGGLPAGIEAMRSAGVWVVGLDMAGPVVVHDLELGAEAVCLVLGAEGRGLGRLVRQRCDVLASIPLHGHLASLNVSAAGAIACYEVARRRAVPTGD